MRSFLVFALLSAVVVCAHARVVLLEAEAFDNPGGWSLDQQFMDQMGSPFLLAHGLGKPVADATASAMFPAAGAYRVWVRTRDWVAPWQGPGAPGRFEVLVNGKAMPVTFGTEGTDWHWQDGGSVDIPAGKTTVALHDLTGFEGRCDAIAFSDDPTFTPPNDAKPLLKWRRKTLGLSKRPADGGSYDFVVVGGGMAGTCAAISAARLGCNVALVQDRPVLGGNNSSEVRVHLSGRINLPPYPALGNLVKELDSGLKGNAQTADHYGDDKKLALVRSTENLTLFLGARMTNVEMNENRIASIVVRDVQTGRETRLSAPLFADCTGDANLGYLAGADFRQGPESRAETGESMAPERPNNETMGTSIMWYSEDAQQPVAFPECPWAVQFTDETCQRTKRGEWDWETGLNRDQVNDFEFIRDHGMRAAYGNWAYLKNKASDNAEYANLDLVWMAYIGGKRESRRLLGDVILQQQDVQEQRPYPDGLVTTEWPIDLHFPKPENAKHFPGEEFRTDATHETITPYLIPYRCLYSR
ncbi:MAG: FAD-dependent oxidoreductase, partial [Candidatus Hydrogenedentales bacterium]